MKLNRMVTSSALLVGLITLLSPLTVMPSYAADSQTKSSQSNNKDKKDSESVWDESMGDSWGDEWDEPKSFWQSFTGFAELSYGQRLQTDPLINEKQTLNEARLQVKNQWLLDSSTVNIRAHGFYDGVQSQWRGQIRELNWQGKVSDNWDLKVGQQVLTWGTGDYVFVNDLFAKDWQSFFAGRDDEYLKAPQLGIKASGYFDKFSVDLVYSPSFTADTYIDGSVFSYYNYQPGAMDVGQFEPSSPESAIRIKINQDQTEYAFYGYSGFEKSPLSAQVIQGQEGQLIGFAPYFAPLNVIGASVRMPAAVGLFNAEVGHYNTSDSDGQNPLVSNDQWKVLVGYEQELMPNVTGSLQWLYEYILDREVGESNQQHRSTVTAQVRVTAIQNKLNVQFFNFYSPSDKDGYARVRVNYKITDTWQVSGGLNHFWGDQPDSFFGQFEDASNAFVSARFYF